MSSPKIIKRYANRKLYDTERSSYVTLDDISVMIKAGEEVQVVDNKSGEDLTSVTFAQIIFEAEKKKSVMPLSLLRTIIRDGSDAIGEFTREQVGKVQDRAQDIREKADALKTELADRVASVKSVVARKGSDVVEPITSTIEAPRAKVQELVAASQRAIDDLQRGVEDRVKGGVGSMSRYANLGREMDDIRKKLSELEQRLEKLPPG
jgi:polyhydroxyalkanoate synthesis repressor PhaR